MEQENEMLEHTNETENIDTQTTEENEDSIIQEETSGEVEEVPEVEEVDKKKSFKEFLRENPDYQEELNNIVKNRLDKQKDRIEREYSDKYGRLEQIVNIGLGTESIEDATEKLTNYYEKKGMKIPDAPKYSDRDIEALASRDAEDIISCGYEDIVEEVERLAKIGLENMTQRDKIVFKKLAEERKREEDNSSLATLGVTREKINSDSEFLEYEKKLNPELSLKEKYEMYLASKPKKKTEKMDSMKSGTLREKEFYTPEEISNLTEEELDDPKVWEAVRRSMTGQS